MAQILIIEDTNDIQDIVRNLLSSQYKVISAYSGTEGLLLFHEQGADLILLDIMLPGLAGDEVLAEIRSESDVPVIIMTALSEKKRISDYLLAGANDYVTKPFDLDELSARITVQLRSKNGTDEDLISYGRLSLDQNDFTAHINGKSIRLSKLEFEILRALVQNPKKIFTKEQLYESAWHEEYVYGDNSVNTQLSNLRKKLAELDGEHEYIETIWGLGVRIIQVKEEHDK